MLTATTIEEFAKEIHSTEIQSRVKSFKELEQLTEDWLKKHVCFDLARNYQSIVDRGLVGENTTFEDFIDKFEEEVRELSMEKGNPANIRRELADVISVGFTMGFHYEIDVFKAMSENIVKNEQRAVNHATS